MKTNNSDYVIESDGLSRSYKQTEALRDVTLRVPRGGIYGFLGRNGSGKTTAIKIFAGLMRPTSGSVRVLGKDPFFFTEEERERVGYVSEKQVLPSNLSVRRIVDFCAPLYPRWDHDLVRRMFDRFRIDDRKSIIKFSQGGKRQVAFILALAQKPELLLLDEPASTLDVVARREFLDAMLEMVREEGPTIFLSSHILTDIERVADHVGIIVDGCLKVSMPLDELKENVRRVRFYSANGNLPEFTAPGELNRKASAKEVMVTVLNADDTLLTETARKFGAECEIEPLSLEDIFVEISRHHEKQPLH